jgi:hypothetical protein
MSAESVVIGELLTAVLIVFAEKAKAAGIEDEELDRLISTAKAKVLATKPADLPDGS